MQNLVFLQLWFCCCDILSKRQQVFSTFITARYKWVKVKYIGVHHYPIYYIHRSCQNFVLPLHYHKISHFGKGIFLLCTTYTQARKSMQISDGYMVKPLEYFWDNCTTVQQTESKHGTYYTVFQEVQKDS